MNKRLLLLGMMILTGFAIAAGLTVFEGAAFAADGAAGCRLVKFTGKVEVQGPGAGSWRAAKAGEVLAEGSRVKTGAKSEAFLSFGGGHAVKVAAMSLMTVSLKGDGGKAGGGLQVSEGKVFAKVSKLDKGASFNVRTPSAVAGVRGTQFSVGVKGGGAGPGATLTSVKGKVEFKKAGAPGWAAAKEGSKVFKDDSLRTGADGACTLAWGKGNVAVVKPLSQVTVNELAGGAAGSMGRNDFTLATGKAVVNAKKSAGAGASFNVRTPTAVAGVRGTKFDVGVSGGDPAKSAAVSGKLLEIKGEVEVLAKGGGTWKKAVDKMAVRAGDSVRTRVGSSCVVAWGKGNAVRVSAMTAMRLDLLNTSPATGGDDSELSVTTGKVFVKAKKRGGTASSFMVKTPTAVAGVRGTKFSVGVSGKGGPGALLAAAAGDVSVSVDGGVKWSPAAKGAVVKEGDSIKTGAGGSCVIAWGKGNVVKVGKLTRMTVDLLRKDADGERSGLKLESGRLQFKAKKLSGGGSSFVIKTPTAVAGVRGTRCELEAGSDGSSARCLDGELEVGGETGEAVSVGPGEKTAVKDGEAPSEPVKMTDVEINEMNADAELSDPAFDAVDVSDAAGEKAGTEVACVEGEVAVASEGGEEVTVKEGEKTEVAAGEAPSAPEEMSQDEVDGFNSEAGLDDPALESAGGDGYERDKPGATEVRCAEGAVEVSSPEGGEPVLIGEGEKSSVADGGQPSPSAAMSPDEKEEINSEGELEDPKNLDTASAPGDGDGGSTDVACVEGALEVASEDGSEVELGAGMKTSVDEGSAPDAPAAMSSEELGAFESEAAGIEAVESSSTDAVDSGVAGKEAGGDDDAAAGLDSIDAAIDNAVINATVEDAAPEETFDIDVDLIFQ